MAKVSVEVQEHLGESFLKFKFVPRGTKHVAEQAYNKFIAKLRDSLVYIDGIGRIFVINGKYYRRSFNGSSVSWVEFFPNI